MLNIHTLNAVRSPLSVLIVRVDLCIAINENRTKSHDTPSNVHHEIQGISKRIPVNQYGYY